MSSAPSWRATARPNQIPPDGDWLIWYLQAGRGWGKTWVGASYTWEMSARCPRIAIVAPSFGDGRDYCIEGETGIKTLHPELQWNRSMGEMTFPSGAKGKLYSSEDPDSLRGPNNYFAWCFVAGTQIATACGSVAIEDVRAGDLVWTRKGLRRVRRAWQTSPSADVYELIATDGYRLTGTADHPIWIEGTGFMPLHLLPYGGILKVWENNHSTTSSQASHGAGVAGGLMAAITATAKASYFTVRSILLHMALFLLALRFIIKMKINSITIYQTSKPSPLPNTARNTAEDIPHGNLSSEAPQVVRNGRSGSSIWRYVRIAAHHLQQPAHDQNTAPIRAGRQTTDHKDFIPSNVCASSAEQRTAHPLHERTRAIAHVLAARKLQIMDAITRSAAPSYAPCVETRSMPMIPEPSPVPANVAFATAPRVVAVNPLNERHAVYNLDVDDCHEYFANGILVHNCDEIASWSNMKATWDMLAFTMRKGTPRWIVTTTPKPYPFLQELKGRNGTVVVRGSTYENIANLAPAYIAQVIAPYEGTDLGRQELNAEDVTDTEGALWSLAQIEAQRVTKAPPLTRIAVGIDPNASGTGDEAGIITAGVGMCDCKGAPELHGFVLSDDSTQGGPRVWANQGVAAYHKHNADVLVAEANQGGDMVAITISTIPNAPPVKLVHASRNKQTRAEPISLLSQQGKIHHVGAFGLLESELRTWTPGSASPNRLDAYVWTLTELMIGSVNADEWLRRYSAAQPQKATV